MDRTQSPKARKAQEQIYVPRKKRKWDLVNSIISATDRFWSNYFPHIYIYIYFAIYSWPKSFFHIIPLALNCITTSGYHSLLTLISLQEELRTKKTIRDGGGLPWNSGLPWEPPETLTDVTSTMTAATNMHLHPGASASSPALFRPSTHITLCMKDEWAEFFIILGYLIAQIVTETEGEETHCWKRKKWIRCLVRTDWNAKEKMTE